MHVALKQQTATITDRAMQRQDPGWNAEIRKLPRARRRDAMPNRHVQRS
ncbi:hypothetical protein [Thermomonas aquatica]|nr:hypothetical protein [Thermomonas aquatica]